MQNQKVSKYGLGSGTVLDIFERLPLDIDENSMPLLVAIDNLFKSDTFVDYFSLRNVSI